MAEPIYPQFFHSGQLNAPQMTGNTGGEGQILQVLDACLCTGFSPSTAVSVAIKGEFVVLTFGVTHGYMKHQFLLVSGASDVALNGKHRIISVTPTTVKLSKGTITSTGGTVKTLLAPLDWENMFGTEDPMQRAYRSKDLTSTRTVLYLDCTLRAVGRYNTTNPLKRAKVDLCRDMLVLGEQIDSYTSYRYSTESGSTSLDGSFHWVQSTYYSNNTKNIDGSRPWVIWGDSKFFYFFSGFCAYESSYPQHWNRRAIYFFGDMPKLSSADQYNCILSATNLVLPRDDLPYSILSEYSFYPFLGNRNTDAYFIKEVTGVGKMEWVKSSSTTTGGANSGGRLETPLDSPLGFGYLFSDVVLRRNVTNYYAGKMPYFNFINTNLSTLDSGLDLTWEGSKLIIRVSATSDWSTDNSYIALDALATRQEDML